MGLLLNSSASKHGSTVIALVSTTLFTKSVLSRPNLRLERHLLEGGRVLELGEESKISTYLKTHDRCCIETYSSDLRYPFVLKDNSYDVVLCLEVIEHIKDRTETSGV